MDKQPYAWSTEEFNINGELVWSSITQFRPKELSWIRDLPNKKHHIRLPLSTKMNRKQRRLQVLLIKSYKESTQKMMEAYNGL
jgi:hypothetical protein